MFYWKLISSNDNNDDLEIFQDGDEFLLQVDSIAKLMNHDLGIISGRCAAHGLQLSIKKGYAASDLTEVLTRVRTTATSFEQNINGLFANILAKIDNFKNFIQYQTLIFFDLWITLILTPGGLQDTIWPSQ